ncbi:hypothetical protein PR048_014948 [Dryococelus australis]|uniref:Uncharacterized protein n=1 Tax=Dryococelus australis TaxID=614101 RepID=A0ABQ9HFL1_9NEOP|nr:hypothetical protein PR048_014948 [Dryococelus australis]
MSTSKPKLMMHRQTAVPDISLHRLTFISYKLQITDLYKTVPLRNRQVTKPPTPWLTNYIVQLMRKCDNAYSNYKRDIRTNAPAVDSIEHYRMQGNKCTQFVRHAKILYSLNSFGSCRTSGELWKRLRNLGIGKCKTNISSPLNISQKTSKQVVGDIIDTTDINHHETVNESQRNLFYFRRVSLKETYRAIMRIKSKAE